MTEAMPRCPYARKRDRGAHDLSFVIPDEFDQPVTVICDKCGMSAQRAISWPKPLDDMSADVIREFSRPARPERPDPGRRR